MKQNSVTTRVAFYIRVSTDEQVEKYGIPLQKDALLGLLKSRGKLQDGTNVMELAGEQYVYIDEGVSGADDLDIRPAFSKLKEDIELAGDSKPFDAVAVYKIDRFARSLRILLDVVDFFELNKIEFLSANESMDTSTPFGKAVLNIIGVIAELERATIKQRTQDGREQAIKAGKVMGSASTYGYRKSKEGTLEIFETEAKIIRDIFNMFLIDKMTAYEIALFLTKSDTPSPEASAVINGKRKGEIKKKNHIAHWKPEKIRTILADEIYTGKYYYGKTVKGEKIEKTEWKLSPIQHKPIIDEPTFYLAQKQLESSKHERVSETGHTYLLSGLLRCENCYDYEKDKSEAHWSGGRKEVGKKTGNYTYFYQCSRKNLSKSYKPCTVLPLPATEIEEYVKDYTLKLLNSPRSVYEHNKQLASTRKELSHLQKRHNDLQGRLNALEMQKIRLKEQNQIGIISISELKERFSEITSKQDNLKLEITEISKNISNNISSSSSLATLEIFSKKYRDFMEKAKNDRKIMYELIHKLFEEIRVESRETKESDTVAGKKKTEQQYIPNKLVFIVKLPKEILSELKQQEVNSLFKEYETFENSNATPVQGENSQNVRR